MAEIFSKYRKKFYLCDMKTRNLLIIVALAMAVASCSTDVDLYADYKDVPVIYGLLDSDADTNYIRITHAIYASDNPFLDAPNAAMSEYPGKLDVRLTEFCNGDSVRQIVLDTITLHNKKPGVFYAPNQKVYYTDQPLGRNSSRYSYHYKLTVELPDHTLVTETDLVGSTNFGPKGLAITLAKTAWGLWMPYHFLPAHNAMVYSVDMTFTFREQRTPESDSVPRTMRWRIGNFYEKDLVHQMDGDNYVFRYRSENFFRALEDFIGADTFVSGLTRYISDYPVNVIITAGGDHLADYLYYQDIINQFDPNDSDFTTITGAKGVFSSRITRSQVVRLAGTTLPELLAEEKWGFSFMGGEP